VHYRQAGSGQSDDPQQLTWAAGALIWLGDEAAARHLNTRAAARARQTGALAILPMILGSLAMAEAHGGQIALAESDAHEGHQLAAELGQPHWLPINLAVLARVAAFRGREQQCQFGQALDLHAGTQRPLDLARTRLLYGEHLRRRKARGAAIAQLRAALGAEFQQLGAHPWAARAEAELRACGYSPAGRRDDLFDQLTPQELQIVRLVSDGLTNRQVAAQMFLSPRTVEYHLAKVYPKLQVTSRTDLVRAYTRRGSPATIGTAETRGGHQ
jgi:DNA-binding CsgD family transcriptional regulator